MGSLKMLAFLGRKQRTSQKTTEMLAFRVESEATRRLSVENNEMTRDEKTDIIQIKRAVVYIHTIHTTHTIQTHNKHDKNTFLCLYVWYVYTQ